MSATLDPYVYPGTDVLRNLPEIRDSTAFAQYERRETAFRLAELVTCPIPGTFDRDHLRAMHLYIFRDVFPWAGQFRTCSLAKLEYEGGPVFHFTEPHLLEGEARSILSKLADRDHLRGLPLGQFADRAAELLADLNRLHPFREGNGRTQRVFLEALSKQAGHPLHFDIISSERNLQASIEAGKGGLAKMIRLVMEAADPRAVAALRQAIGFFEKHSFPWNRHYLAMTTPGEFYEGKFAGRDGSNFLLMDTRASRILVGYVRDLPAGAATGEPVRFTASEWEAGGPDRSL